MGADGQFGPASQGGIGDSLSGILPPRRRPKGVGPVPASPPPGMVLYLACGTGGGKGRVYQVDESGGVLGVVDLPYAPTGVALHRQNGVVAVSPSGTLTALRLGAAVITGKFCRLLAPASPTPPSTPPGVPSRRGAT